MSRAEELVRAMEGDATFTQEVQDAPTAEAKRAVVERHGFSDVSLDDMKAYAESQGGKLVVTPNDGELSEQELNAVAGGLSDTEIAVVTVIAVQGTAAVAVAAAA